MCGQQRLVGEQVGAAAVGDDAPGRKDDGALAQLQGERQVVRHDDQRALDLVQHGEQFAPRTWVEVCRRLVEHEEGRLHRENGGDRDAPALAHGQSVRRAVLAAEHPDGAEREAHALADLAPSRPRLRGPKATSSDTVGMNSWSSGSWKTSPTRARSSRICRPWTSIPARRGVPRRAAGR